MTPFLGEYRCCAEAAVAAAVRSPRSIADSFGRIDFVSLCRPRQHRCTAELHCQTQLRAAEKTLLTSGPGLYLYLLQATLHVLVQEGRCLRARRPARCGDHHREEPPARHPHSTTHHPAGAQLAFRTSDKAAMSSMISVQTKDLLDAALVARIRLGSHQGRLRAGMMMRAPGHDVFCRRGSHVCAGVRPGTRRL